MAVSLPSKELVSILLQLKLRVFAAIDVDEYDAIELSTGLVEADYRASYRRAIKRMILSNQEFLSIQDLKQAQAKEVKRYIRMQEEYKHLRIEKELWLIKDVQPTRIFDPYTRKTYRSIVKSYCTD